MDWKKRKRCRKIAHHYGFKHWWEYNRYLKAAIRTEHSRYIVDHPNEFHWRELLDAYNKICDEFGTPEKKLTENEWLDKVKEHTNEMMIDRDKKFMDLLDEAIRKRRISSKHNIDVIRGHRPDRLPGGENWKYPAQIHVDLAQNPDVTTEARIGISPKGDVKFYGFDICKT